MSLLSANFYAGRYPEVVQAAYGNDEHALPLSDVPYVVASLAAMRPASDKHPDQELDLPALDGEEDVEVPAKDDAFELDEIAVRETGDMFDDKTSEDAPHEELAGGSEFNTLGYRGDERAEDRCRYADQDGDEEQHREVEGEGLGADVGLQRGEQPAGDAAEGELGKERLHIAQGRLAGR